MPLFGRYRTGFLKGVTVFIVVLILFQSYQTFFNSWISEHYGSTRSALLSRHLSGIGEGPSIFLYNVPEAVIFLDSQNYYQYLQAGDIVMGGEENLAALFRGEPGYVLVDDEFPYTDRLLPLYAERSRFDKYVLYEKTVR